MDWKAVVRVCGVFRQENSAVLINKPTTGEEQWVLVILRGRSLGPKAVWVIMPMTLGFPATVVKRYSIEASSISDSLKP